MARTISGMNIVERNQLRSALVGALTVADGQKWSELTKRCHEAGAEYLLTEVRQTFYVAAERFDRFNPSE